MKPAFRGGICLLSLLGPLALSSPAAAQDIAAADALFTRGIAEMKDGNYVKGCPLIAESLTLDPQPGTLFALSQCEMKWGRIATAVARLTDYLQLHDRLTREQQTQQLDRPKVAREQRDKLTPQVPELTLSLPAGAPAGTVVRRDTVVVAPAAFGLGLPVNPGEHVLSTQAPGGPLREQRITIAVGEKRALVLEVKPAPLVGAPAAAGAAQAPRADAGPSGRRVAAYAVGGVGVASLVLGGVMGGLALGKKATIDAHCGSGIGSPDAFACDDAGLAAVASLKPLGLASTIGFAAGLASLGAGIVLFLTEPRPAKPETGARAPWISASLISAGPAGAMVGAHGRW